MQPVRLLLVHFCLAQRPRPNPTPALSLTRTPRLSGVGLGRGSCAAPRHISVAFKLKGRPKSQPRLDQSDIGVARFFLQGDVAIRRSQLNPHPSVLHVTTVCQVLHFTSYNHVCWTNYLELELIICCSIYSYDSKRLNCLCNALLGGSARHWSALLCAWLCSVLLCPVLLL